MSDEAAFLRAIAESPDDDSPRLVFADWLDEHGDSAWAEFIRAQVELAQLDEADKRYPGTLARSRRAGVLTRSATRPFVDHVPGGQVMFRRGLIAGVRMKASAYRDTASNAWGSVPTEQLWLDEPATGPGWADRPELARKRGTELDLSPLFTCRTMPELCTLRYSVAHQEMSAVARQFARAPDMPHLSLIQCMWGGNGGWFVLADGEAHQVRRDVIAWESDW